MIEEKDVMLRMRDGVEVATRIYRPAGPGPFPVLYAASPYRYDNNELPATPQFLWRETGPIEWYVEQGYAYVHADVRGTGKSGGDYGLFSEAEQRDHYDIIEWIAAQAWSNGKVGGIGQSYYAMSQWHMGIQNPPHLACIAPYDGMLDFYRFFGTLNGIESDWFSIWFNNNVRVANKYPANGGTPRNLPHDMAYLVGQHPLNDDFWKERTAIHRVAQIKVPVFSIGVWAKQDLHLEGNILASRLLGDKCKLLISGVPTPFHAAGEFESIPFHRDVMLPFYDRYLKGIPSAYDARPAVEYPIRNSSLRKQETSWPPTNARREKLFLGTVKTGSVNSVNDGSLHADAAVGEGRDASITYSYPHPDWVLGTAVITPQGPDTVRGVLTFTSAPLESDRVMAGNAKAVIHVESTRHDTDVFVKITEQFPLDAAAVPGQQPRAVIVTKGCLRASHALHARARDAALSTPDAPYYLHEEEHFSRPGTVMRLEIPLRPMAYHFRKGSRIRVEIANTDTPVTEVVWAHIYNPQKIGSDTLYLREPHASYVEIPFVD
ncbi:MAG: CocE/NonD family hydrolase [Pseudomonadota bacterium]